MIRFIDDILNDITMYRFVTYGLGLLAVLSIVLGFTGPLGQDGWQLLFGLGITLGACYVSNLVIARMWEVPANTESWLITALIVFFILPPPANFGETGLIALAGLVAIASKFLITWNGKHIFNPAAFGGFVLGTLSLFPATWWVGNKALFPVMLIFGLLVVRKIRRFAMFLSFAGASLAIAAVTASSHQQGIGEALQAATMSSPLLFLGTIMLTEPATMPARRTQQIIFGAGVGILYAFAWKLGPVAIYPETALLVGNIYAFAVNPRYRLRLKLVEIQRIGGNVANFVFAPDRRALFLPGQYMEFTLAHADADSRGNRRTLSMASSPTEETVHVGVKFHSPSSSFKRALARMQPGDVIYGGQTAGDFTLPDNSREKLLFLAAGIGITPFRSMLQYLADNNEQRDIVMIYAVSDPHELAYVDVLREAVGRGVRIIPLLSSGERPDWWQGLAGRLDAGLIATRVPDYQERTVYLSGPNGMVEGVTSELRRAGVHRTSIRTDHFTGY
jgi:ferredoxin-NADP reductase/Na+-translocating ferredoxin:NAD+ oxidoreductase RnfD subunit